MNSNELHGDVRYVAGKVEKGIGDAVDSRKWQADGVIDQIAGTAEHLYGRARSVAADLVDAAPGLADDVREKVGDTADRAARAAQRGSAATTRLFADYPAFWAVVAGIGGYGLAWLVHGRD